MSKHYLTTPIYYVNAWPHLGHAYTTLAADILARYYRLKGDEVLFLTGTDEHGAKIQQAADKAGKAPQIFVDEVSSRYKAVWEKLNISYDQFIRTTDAEHIASVQKFMERLQERKALYLEEYSGLYCVGCEKFITEKDLVDGKCPDHGTAPEKIKEKNYFFKLKEYLPFVKQLIEKDEIKILPQEKKNEVLGLFKQELEDFSLSRQNVTWGIPMPFDTAQTVYVWVDALINYISAVGYGRDEVKYKKWWPADLHLMAKEILKFHAVYWPAMLMAAGEKLPHEIFVHGYFTVNGEKMSKTKGNVLDPVAMVEKFGADATRYLLMSQFPFERDGDIKAEQFMEKYNSDLANNLGNLVSRVSQMIEKFFNGEVPEFEIEVDYDLEKINRLLEELQFSRALEEMWKIISTANQMIEEEKPWELAQNRNMDKLGRLLYTLSVMIKDLALALEPVMPETADKIQQIFKQKVIQKTVPLFPRLYVNPPKLKHNYFPKHI